MVSYPFPIGFPAVSQRFVEEHEAEVARLAVSNNELTERLRLSETKLTRTEASVVRGNHALATERVQYKQKIVSLTEEMNTLREKEKRAVDELASRADDSVQLSKAKAEVEVLTEKVAVAESCVVDVAPKLLTRSPMTIQICRNGNRRSSLKPRSTSSRWLRRRLPSTNSRAS